MSYYLKVPARINILGNPSDAVEGDFATISMAISLYAHAIIEPSDKIVFEMRAPGSGNDNQSKDFPLNSVFECELSNSLIPMDDEPKLCKGAFNFLLKISPEFRSKICRRGFRLTTWSEVPRQSGLGGSSLFVILTLAALREFYHLDTQIMNNYVLAEMTQRIEENELGITCGFADRYVPIFGGLAYIDYRGKLFHKSITQEPFATYEILNRWAGKLSLVAITTGLKHDSGNIHHAMRTKYLEEYNTWYHKGGSKPPMIKYMERIWETAWKGKIALLNSEMETFGQMMNLNHGVVNDMMNYCGFQEGAGRLNNLLIQTALNQHALGAKLTGAGQGGSIYALVKPGKENELADVWEKQIKELNLQNASIYTPKISVQGLSIKDKENKTGLI
ncbi:MAG TPA: hypothetical protein G4N95_00925 [Anaerolineae bacterium]|nr:hypothetical protein [Anaerolineae bacterium]